MATAPPTEKAASENDQSVEEDDELNAFNAANAAYHGWAVAKRALYAMVETEFLWSEFGGQLQKLKTAGGD